jgi:hypothetical protein
MEIHGAYSPLAPDNIREATKVPHKSELKNELMHLVKGFQKAFTLLMRIIKGNPSR